MVLHLLWALCFCCTACTEDDDDDDTEESLRITSIMPIRGAEGAIIQIKGTGFGEDPSSVRVLFGTTAASIDGISNTRITTRVPQGGSSGTITVHVGENSIESTQSFSVEASPSITEEEEEAATRQQTIDDYINNYLAAASDDDIWTGEVSSCRPGDISSPLRNKALQRLNYFRRQSGYANNLPLNPTLNTKCQASALIMKANNALSHVPPMGWDCWTADGAEASRGNLAYISRATPGYASRSIPQFIEDAGNNNARVGHRGWFLHPGLKKIGVGATDQTTTVWWLFHGNDDYVFPTASPAYVAWPPEGFVIDALVYERWSFHLIEGAPLSSLMPEEYSIDNARVRMWSDSDGEAVSFNGEVVKAPSGQLGMQTLVWMPDINANISGEDVVYRIVIDNLVVNGNATAYEYEVTLIDAQSIPSARVSLKEEEEKDKPRVIIH